MACACRSPPKKNCVLFILFRPLNSRTSNIQKSKRKGKSRYEKRKQIEGRMKDLKTLNADMIEEASARKQVRFCASLFFIFDQPVSCRSDRWAQFCIPCRQKCSTHTHTHTHTHVKLLAIWKGVCTVFMSHTPTPFFFFSFSFST